MSCCHSTMTHSEFNSNQTCDSRSRAANNHKLRSQHERETDMSVIHYTREKADTRMSAQDRPGGGVSWVRQQHSHDVGTVHDSTRRQPHWILHHGVCDGVQKLVRSICHLYILFRTLHIATASSKFCHSEQNAFLPATKSSQKSS